MTQEQLKSLPDKVKIIPTREFFENTIKQMEIDIQRSDAVRRFCQSMLQNKVYVENGTKNQASG